MKPDILNLNKHCKLVWDLKIIKFPKSVGMLGIFTAQYTVYFWPQPQNILSSYTRESHIF